MLPPSCPPGSFTQFPSGAQLKTISGTWQIGTPSWPSLKTCNQQAHPTFSLPRVEVWGGGYRSSFFPPLYLFFSSVWESVTSFNLPSILPQEPKQRVSCPRRAHRGMGEKKQDHAMKPPSCHSSGMHREAAMGSGEEVILSVESGQI